MLEISRHIFEKYSNIKFYENPSSGSRVVPCGRTDMTKLIFAFRNFTNAPKIHINVALHFILNALCHIVFSASITATHAIL